MKRYILLFIVVLLTAMQGAYAQKSNSSLYVEVMYFHGKQRCPTCRAIEKYTKEVLAQDFAKEVKQGKVIFKEVDLSTREGEKIADSYKVTWSSLFVNQWKKKKETRNDLTKMAFRNARNNTPEFKSQLKEKINESLK